MEKLLSVIIPAYNVGQYLSKGLDSLNVPDWRDRLDVLVVNDGSIDITSAIGHAFASRYPETFRIIDKENGNYGSCINLGLKEARGVFVKVLDGDDYFDRQGLVKLLKTLDRVSSDASEVDLVLFNTKCVDTSGQTWGHGVDLGNYKTIPLNKPFDINAVDMPAPIVMPMMAYRRSVFSKFDYHQTEKVSYTDIEWRVLPMTQVRKVYAVPVVVYLYLVGRDGQTMNPATYARKFQVVADLVKHMVDEYEKLKDTSLNLKYLQRCLQYQVDMTYFTALCGWHEYDTVVDVKDFDDYIKTTGPEFYAQARNKEMRFGRFPLSLFSFYPTRIWDRWHTVNAPRLWIHRQAKRFFKRGKIF